MAGPLLAMIWSAMQSNASGTLVDRIQGKTLSNSTEAEAIEPGTTLSTQDWIDVAKANLIRSGIGAVKIDRLAQECGVTRGGFYWRFKSRDELLATLLDDWVHTNTEPLLAAIKAPGTFSERFERLVDLWLDEQAFSPSYDNAVRAWSKGDPKVAAVVREVDDRRVDALAGLFEDHGFDHNEALVRARITYYHQVGYYALDIDESLSSRSGLRSLYVQVLTGQLGK